MWSAGAAARAAHFEWLAARARAECEFANKTIAASAALKATLEALVTQLSLDVSDQAGKAARDHGVPAFLLYEAPKACAEMPFANAVLTTCILGVRARPRGAWRGTQAVTRRVMA